MEPSHIFEYDLPVNRSIATLEPEIEQALAEALDVTPDPGADGLVKDWRAAPSPEF